MTRISIGFAHNEAFCLQCWMYDMHLYMFQTIDFVFRSNGCRAGNVDVHLIDLWQKTLSFRQSHRVLVQVNPSSWLRSLLIDYIIACNQSRLFFRFCSVNRWNECTTILLLVERWFLRPFNMIYVYMEIIVQTEWYYNYTNNLIAFFSVIVDVRVIGSSSPAPTLSLSVSLRAVKCG